MQSLDPEKPTPWLRQLFASAVAAVQAENCLPVHLPAPPVGRTLVVGAGKAAAAMAQSVEAHWSGPLSGFVVTRYGHGADCKAIEVREAGHPVPDATGMDSARRMRAAVADLGADDLVLALISGGGSSLLALPAAGITLADKQHLSRALLHSGATIQEMNIVRSHLSAIKGGRLAVAAAPTPVASLVISDIPDNNPAWVASGPTIANDTTPAQALAILTRYNISVPQHVRTTLEQSRPAADVTPAHNTVTIIATATDALNSARQTAESAGIDVHVLGDALEGEARELGREHALQALRLQTNGLRRPTLLLSGGETSVTVDSAGRGGRNTEYLLGLTLALDGAAGIHALAADTDGIDGSEDNAGAVAGPDTLNRAQAAGLNATQCLAHHDAYGFFAALDNLVVTGPTLTNVNDFRAILVLPQ